ncbi:uncharacterized protein LOC134665245 isoform X2 [Cydia fagiglandana]|uniref:uncharacterized protein LOC134665245 isoform X2 n=1 Tax=Cydia fagiglandana TaxID=1458189 RepID=UPI002FEDF2E2
MSRTRTVPAHTRFVALTLALTLALASATPSHPRPRARRQLAEDNSLQPEQEAQGEVAGRPKRKLEGLAQATYGIKNAVLGLAFGKVNSIIDAKTRLVDTLDRTNIEKNRALGIETPRNDGLASLGGLVSQIAGPFLQLIGPKIQAVSGLLGGLSGGSSSGSGGIGGLGQSTGGAGGGGLGSVLSLVSSLSGSLSGGAGAGATVETIDSSEEEDDSS